MQLITALADVLAAGGNLVVALSIVIFVGLIKCRKKNTHCRNRIHPRKSGAICALKSLDICFQLRRYIFRELAILMILGKEFTASKV